MSALREECSCGHDKATHFPDEELVDEGGRIRVRRTVRKTCLARGCECRKFEQRAYER